MSKGAVDVDHGAELRQAFLARAEGPGLTGPAHPLGVQQYAFSLTHIPAEELADPDKLASWVLVSQRGVTLRSAAEAMLGGMITT